MTRLTTALVALAALLWLVSCGQDAYHTGEGPYSLMRADFGVAHTDGQGHIVRAETDEGSALTLQPALATAWKAKADTVYRVLLYYQVNEETPTHVVPMSAAPVAVLRPLHTLRPDTLRHDPVGVESVWRSSGGRWINLGLAVMTGKTEADTRQMLGVTCDTLLSADGQPAALRYRLLHDQRGVPQYYTQRTYVSIPLGADLQALPATVSVETYEGASEWKI